MLNILVPDSVRSIEDNSQTQHYEQDRCTRSKGYVDCLEGVASFPELTDDADTSFHFLPSQDNLYYRLPIRAILSVFLYDQDTIPYRHADLARVSSCFLHQEFKDAGFSVWPRNQLSAT